MQLGENGRHCPVYATQRMKFVGLEIEELAMGVVSFVVLQMLINVLLAMVLAVFLVRTFRKAGDGKPPGYLIHAASLWTGRVGKTTSSLRGLSESVDSMWTSSGSLPPPTSRNRYRP
jgi:hypothetical protein